MRYIKGFEVRRRENIKLLESPERRVTHSMFRTLSVSLLRVKGKNKE